ncbi:hypothetical protein N7539_001884 [Penicillium diatomitis]|uniref:Prefoldin subunit n=1 Tax=Penicillium diatomitis TaxID=2819901 RepID=A0A9W9XHV2_9EURO|nr:uncharacterized protein N7539_001884 [Penicillium diatomitis]KAJ5493138.1 hypothetical protein N7539_001884 [Penicillium diatomitis]
MSLAFNHVRGLSGLRHNGKHVVAIRAGLLQSTPVGLRRLLSSRSNAESLQPLQIDGGNDVHTYTSGTDRESFEPDSWNLSDLHASTISTSLSRQRTGNPSGSHIPTPSEHLARSLRQSGHSLGSHLNTSRDLETLSHSAPPALQTMLGNYIRQVDPLLPSEREGEGSINELNMALNDVFGHDAVKYLDSRGYDIGDVVAWAWIMKSKDAEQAISRLFIYSTQCSLGTNHPTPPAPPFIILYLLKQKHVTARSLRLLLIYALHLVSGRPLPMQINNTKIAEDYAISSLEEFSPQIDLSTGMLLFIRLVHHSRRVWPHAMPTIASAFSRFMMATDIARPEALGLDKCNADRLKTKNFNIFLHILCLPAKIQPFQSVTYQQQAQFELLRAMANHKPVLPLTRKGYRAVATVQLAHKKTPDERQSAVLKAPSWPPWKEARLGIDKLRGNEGMYSRTMNVLAQMREAGYSRKLWEDVCSILAGWDTDQSPTIQTRSFMPWSKSLGRASHTNPDHPAIWTARIRATRTVREAWACFLSYQDRNLPLNKGVYTAMAEKLINRQSAIQRRFDESDHALPGDGREVYAEPASARDLIYVHTEPPALQDFLEQMIGQGISIPSHLLALLLQTTPDFRAGLQYLSASDLPKEQVEVLTTILGHPSNYEEAKAPLRAISDDVFGAFVGFLCRSSSSVICAGPKSVDPARLPILAVCSQWHLPRSKLTDFEIRSRQKCHPAALWHAVQLAKARLVPCTVCWTHILGALHKAGDRYVKEHRAWRRILAWHEALLALKWMKERDTGLSLDGFYALCKVFNGAVYAGLKHPDEAGQAFTIIQTISHSDGYYDTTGHDQFDAMIENGLLVLKSEFDSLVLPFSATSKLAEQSIFAEMDAADSQLRVPTILHIPSFAVLHRFVRVLGAVGDDEGVLHLLQWMSRSASSLNAAADERLNGDRMRRLTLTAIRLILQGMNTDHLKIGHASSNTVKVQEAHDIIRQTAGWDWPSDEEVEDYYQRYKSEHQM